MGIRSVLLEVTNEDSYNSIHDFISEYDNQYTEMGLIFHKPTGKYYVSIECSGEYFVRYLNDKCGRIFRLEDFAIFRSPNGYKIKNTIYFRDTTECIEHYRNYSRRGA